MSNTDDSNKTNNLPFWPKAVFGSGVLLFVIAIGSYSLWFWYTNQQNLSHSTNDWGTFGDFIGGLTNPMISLAVLYLLARTYLLQKEELHETREAIKSQAVELKRSAKANEELVSSNEKIGYLNTVIANQQALDNLTERTIQKISLVANQQTAGYLNSVFTETGKPVLQIDILKTVMQQAEKKSDINHKLIEEYINNTLSKTSRTKAEG